MQQHQKERKTREGQEDKQTHKQITKDLQWGGERNPWKSRTEWMKKRTETPRDKKKNGNREKKSRWGSNREYKERLPPNQNQWWKKTPKKKGQLKMTFSVLQKENTDLLQEEEEPPQIVNTDKDEN